MLPAEKLKVNWTALTDPEGYELCRILREELIWSVSKTGGHLASNLGDVELTVALHRVYDTARDRIVFDVGHQCYCHKMLTGRAGQMDTLRQLGGLSGFPKPRESDHDAFVAGHASNSISVALGMARARTLAHEDYDVAALIGDGALTGGLAYEGLSNAGQSGERMVVIVNDNGMSIRPNVGGIAKLLSRHRLRPQYLSLKKFYRSMTRHIPGGESIYQLSHRIKQHIKGSLLPSTIFEELGFVYMGPVDGHNLHELTRILRWAKEQEGPVVVHVRTVKGKGYPPAEQMPDRFHGVSPFDIDTGKPLKPSGTDFSAVFGKTLAELGEKNSKICAVTAAMQSGTGLDAFAARFPERCFDVGIAEGHAVTMCGGMAKQGMVPVFAVYSTFLQRSYDMLMHDVALSHLHVVFGVDRAGLVGADGETHQGLYDLAFLSTVPGMTVLAPASFAELSSMLRQAVEDCHGPVAVRYPRGGENGYAEDRSEGSAVLLREGSGLTIVSYGISIGDALAVAEETGAELVKLNQISPLEPEPVLRSLRKTGRLLVLEEVAAQNCVGEQLCSLILQKGIAVKSVRLLNCGEQFVPHGSVPELRKLLGIDRESVLTAAREMMSNE